MQAAGFEPAKHYAEDLEPSPFDHSGTPAQLAEEQCPLDSSGSNPTLRSLSSEFDGMVDLATRHATIRTASRVWRLML